MQTVQGPYLRGEGINQKKGNMWTTSFSRSIRRNQHCNGLCSRLGSPASFVRNQRLPYRLVDLGCQKYPPTLCPDFTLKWCDTDQNMFCNFCYQTKNGGPVVPAAYTSGSDPAFARCATHRINNMHITFYYGEFPAIQIL